MATGRYWPYDEVELLWDESLPESIVISSPWLTVRANIDGADHQRVDRLVQKFSDQAIGLEDADDLNWFFSSFGKYPLSYLLPKERDERNDTHVVESDDLNFEDPRNLLQSLLGQRSLSAEMKTALGRVAEDLSSKQWTWDVDSALAFSRAASGGHDPESLFSISRRFHLLNDVECNRTGELLEYVKSLSARPELFAYASAMVIRQNHYITEQCESVLRAALPSSQGASEEVLEFMSAEAGHDQILRKALDSLNFNKDELPVLSSVVILMEVFRAIGQRNLLAFSMVVDVFERTSYKATDPVADLLHEGGASIAAEQLEAHRHINDAGGHENVAVGFLAHMKNVSGNYGGEAIRLAELLTLVIHMMSPATIDSIKSYRSLKKSDSMAIA